MVNSETEVRRDAAAISYSTLNTVPNRRHGACTADSECKAAKKPNRECRGWPVRARFCVQPRLHVYSDRGLPGRSVNWSTIFEVEHFFYATLF